MRREETHTKAHQTADRRSDGLQARREEREWEWCQSPFFPGRILTTNHTNRKKGEKLNHELEPRSDAPSRARSFVPQTPVCVTDVAC